MLDRFSFLDLYAGSGAVALEAASRGAGPVTAVEADRATAELIRENARSLKLSLEVRATTVETALRGAPRPFDIVWLDPPYDVASEVVEGVIGRVVEDWLAPDGLIIVERSSRDGVFTWPDMLRDHRSRRYGETTLFLASQEVA